MTTKNKSRFADRLRKAAKQGSTLAQRSALFKMHSALGWSLQGIRNMTFDEASAAIDKAKVFIKLNGFPNT